MCFSVLLNVSRTEAIDFAINLYVKSYSHNLADDYYDNMIDPILSEMTVAQLVSLIDGSDKNSQIYDRRKFTGSSFRIKEALRKKILTSTIVHTQILIVNQ